MAFEWSNFHDMTTQKVNFKSKSYNMKIIFIPFLFILFFSKKSFTQSNCLILKKEADGICDSAKLLYSNSQNQAAFNYIGSFEERLKKCPQDSFIAEGYHQIARFYYEAVKDKVQALVYFQKAFAIRNRVLSAFHPNVERNYFMLGACYKELGQYTFAEPYLKQAIDISEYRKDTSALVRCLLSLGSVYGYLGDNEKGKSYINKASLIYKSLNNTVKIAECELELGLLFIRQRLFDSATIHLKEGLNLYQSLNKLTELGNTSVNYCIALQGTDSLPKALSTAQQAIKYYTQTKPENSDMSKRIGNAYIELGNCYQKLKQNMAAKTAYLDAIHKFQTDTSLAINPYHAEAYRQLGALLLAQNQPQQALEQYQKAFTILVPSFKSDDILETPSVKTDIYAPMEVLQLLSLKSHALYQLSKNHNAPPQYLKAFKQIIKQIDTLHKDLRLSFIEDRSKFDLVKMLLPVYQDAISLSWQQEHDADAVLHYFEKNKAVALREWLQDNAARRFAGVNSTTLSKENNLKGLRSDFQRQVLGGHDEYRDSLMNAKKDLDDFVKTLEDNNPEYYKLKYETAQTLTIDSIQARLPPNMAFIEYFYGIDSLYCLAISKKKTVFKSFPISGSFEKQIGEFVKALSEKDTNNNQTKKMAIYLQSAHPFYNDLLKPVLSELNADSSINRLKIVPDGLLCHLPFAALLEQEETDWTSSKEYQVPYLIQNYALSYDFSADIAFDSTYHTPSENKKWYGVGLSYEYENKKYPNLATKFQILKYAHSEMRNLKSILPNATIATDSILNSTEKQTVLRNMFKHNNLHFSMHGFMDEREPLNSALVLTRLEEKSDYLLTASDLYGESFGTDKMVILSACNTGNGVLHRGEGMMCLGRAFAYSGFSTMVLTNWSVNDLSTGILLTDFYKSLNQGLPKDIALQKAQIAYLKSGIFQPSNATIPNRWAGLKVIGKIGGLF